MKPGTHHVLGARLGTKRGGFSCAQKEWCVGRARTQREHVNPTRPIVFDYEGELPSQPVFLVYHRELRRTARFKLVIQVLEAALRAAFGG